MKRYAVTGANGLIGMALVSILVESGHRVLAICRSGIPVEFLDLESVEVAQGDVRDLEFLIRAMKDVDGIFHVAAFAKPWAKDPKIYYEVNEQGAINVCEAAVKNGVNRVVYTASAGIHGPQQGDALIDESTWPSSYHTDYEQSKFNGMKAALAFKSEGLEVNVVSPARVYAPGKLTESNVPARLMAMYVKRGFALVPMNGNGLGSYVAIDDVVLGHIIAMECSQHGEEFLLGGTNATYLQFFNVLQQVSGQKGTVIKVPYTFSLWIGKINLFLAEEFGIKPTITTPWVRRYLKNWGVSSAKIEALGYKAKPLEHGMHEVLNSWKHDQASAS